MLTEAARLDLIPFNPWKSVKALIPGKKKFGTLSINEGRKLLHSESIDTLWEGKFIFYMITKLAFMSGLRIGEANHLRLDLQNKRSS